LRLLPASRLGLLELPEERSGRVKRPLDGLIDLREAPDPERLVRHDRLSSIDRPPGQPRRIHTV
jgi:hypothetical protein